MARVLPVAHPTAPSAWTVVPKAATGTLRKVTPVLASGVPQPASGFDALVFAFQDYDPTEVCVCACVCAGLNAMGDCVAQVRCPWTLLGPLVHPVCLPVCCRCC